MTILSPWRELNDGQALFLRKPFRNHFAGRLLSSFTALCYSTSLTSLSTPHLKLIYLPLVDHIARWFKPYSYTTCENVEPRILPTRWSPIPTAKVCRNHPIQLLLHFRNISAKAPCKLLKKINNDQNFQSIYWFRIVATAAVTHNKDHHRVTAHHNNMVAIHNRVVCNTSKDHLSK